MESSCVGQQHSPRHCQHRPRIAAKSAHDTAGRRVVSCHPTLFYNSGVCRCIQLHKPAGEAPAVTRGCNGEGRRFFARHQQDCEKLRDFLCSLREIAASCEFCASRRDQRLSDQPVMRKLTPLPCTSSYRSHIEACLWRVPSPYASRLNLSAATQQPCGPPYQLWLVLPFSAQTTTPIAVKTRACAISRASSQLSEVRAPPAARAAVRHTKQHCVVQHRACTVAAVNVVIMPAFVARHRRYRPSRRHLFPRTNR